MYFGLALVIFGVLQDNIQYVATLIPQDKVGLFTATVGLIVAVLRWLTTDALADK